MRRPTDSILIDLRTTRMTLAEALAAIDAIRHSPRYKGKMVVLEGDIPAVVLRDREGPA